MHQVGWAELGRSTGRRDLLRETDELESAFRPVLFAIIARICVSRLDVHARDSGRPSAVLSSPRSPSRTVDPLHDRSIPEAESAYLRLVPKRSRNAAGVTSSVFVKCVTTVRLHLSIDGSRK